MNATAGGKAIPNENEHELEARVLARIVREGYGPGAWHGPDLKAALADVSPELAFWTPSPERHSIAEIALHHAYYTRSVRARLSGAEPEPFVLEGDDWFALPGETGLTWPRIAEVVDDQHSRLANLIEGIGAGRVQPALAEPERFDLVLGIACHAVYHAGQVQLLKRLHAGQGGSSH